MDELKRVMKAIEEDIRLGRFNNAIKRLKRVKSSSVPRKYRKDLSAFARRVRHYPLALRFLWEPIRVWENATEEEIIEYAATLIRVGSAIEAQGLLTTCRTNPKAHLIRGFCEVVQWNYVKAAQYFEDYLNDPRSEDYQRRVAYVNLLSCHVMNRDLERGQALAVALRNQLSEKESSLLLANVLELHVQLQIYAGKFKDASRDLELARHLPSAQTDQQALFLNRLQLVINAELKSPRAGRTDFERLMKEARRLLDFESLRELTYLAGKYLRDSRYLELAYFGTPYRSFRKWFEELEWRPPASVVLHAGRYPQFDLTNLPNVKCGSQSALLLRFLLNDIFAPKSVGEIFRLLHPDQYYDIFSSPVRVYKAGSRLRHWIEAHAAGWILRSASGRLFLDTSVGPSIRMTDDPTMAGTSEFEILIHRAKEKWNRETFLRVELQTFLGISESKARRLLNWAINQGIVERYGASTQTRYFFMNESVDKPG